MKARPKIIVHNHYSRSVRDEEFAPGTTAYFKGMPVLIEGPGPKPNMLNVRRADTKKGLTVEKSFLKKGEFEERYPPGMRVRGFDRRVRDNWYHKGIVNGYYILEGSVGDKGRWLVRNGKYDIVNNAGSYAEAKSFAERSKAGGAGAQQPVNKAADHWHRVTSIGRYDILEGAGTDGGSWLAKERPGRGRPEIKRFKTRREAEEHAEMSQDW